MCASYFFFFNDTATTEIYTLSLHDALPILGLGEGQVAVVLGDRRQGGGQVQRDAAAVLHAGAVMVLGEHVRPRRSEEHTSELQSRQYLVCRLLLEKKKKTRMKSHHMKFAST